MKVNFIVLCALLSASSAFADGLLRSSELIDVYVDKIELSSGEGDVRFREQAQAKRGYSMAQKALLPGTEMRPAIYQALLSAYASNTPVSVKTDSAGQITRIELERK